MGDILGAIILYNPPLNVVDNIKSYNHSVNHLLIIDNSETEHLLEPILIELFAEATYIKNKENFGIAKALNQAAEYGISKGYKWLLTMDQDSSFAERSADELVKLTKEYTSDVAIISPIHINKDNVVKHYDVASQRIKKTMTSGNIINLELFKLCGPFEEKLFIDYVDHEFNLRLQKNKFSIIRANTSFLIHNLGEIQSYRFLFLSMKTTNHNSIRRYYITRNRLYVTFKYFSFAPKFFFREMYNYWIDILRILLLEKNKREKIFAVFKGTKDWLLGKYGKLNKL